jgi:hypothetical protein
MKLASSLTGALALSGTTLAAVLPKRASAVTDGDVLNYALTLEHLEDKFYRDGLGKFNQKQFADAGFDATFYQNLKEISHDESTHVSFLTTALKGNPSHRKPVSFLLTNTDNSCRYCSGLGMQICFRCHIRCHICRNCINPRGRWRIRMYVIHPMSSMSYYHKPS